MEFKTRRFEGKIYVPFYWHKKKKAVEKQATFQRKLGFYTRIIRRKHPTLGIIYRLYVRRKLMG